MTKRKYTDDELFQLWVSMGDDRSIQKVADVAGMAYITIAKKSGKYNWKERLQDMQEENKSLITALVTDNSNAVALTESIVYRGVSETLLRVLQESMLMLKPTENPREIKTILDTYRLINGQPTDISKQEVTTGVQVDTSSMTEEEKKLLDSVATRALFGEHQA